MKKPATLKYELTIPKGLYDIAGFGEVDLRALSLDKADELFAKDFPHLKVKTNPSAPVSVPEVVQIVKKGKKAKL